MAVRRWVVRASMVRTLPSGSMAWGPMNTCSDSQCTRRLANVPVTEAGCLRNDMSSPIS